MSCLSDPEIFGTAERQIRRLKMSVREKSKKTCRLTGDRLHFRFIAAGLPAMLTVLLLAGCRNASGNGNASVQESMTEAEQNTAPDETKAAEIPSREAADAVGRLIDAIYVQERTADTDRLCREAREAWDSLSDAEKEMVTGENADPDYFGRDTGDAAKDDPLNQDGIGENELLVVSFGTSFNDSRAEDIGGIERRLAKAFPEWSVRRAFTAQIIINHIQARDGEVIDNMTQALERAVKNHVKNLVIQPTHLMEGAEYDELLDAVREFEGDFASVRVAYPMLGAVGSTETKLNEDKKTAAEAIVSAAVKTAGASGIEALSGQGTALVLMGHGTSHNAKISYTQMQRQMDVLGYDNVFIGTVEGEPEETACEAVIERVKQAGFRHVILRPLMVVSGDHANNDMAGDDEDSWRSQFLQSGYFDTVDTQIQGMGRIPAVQEIYVSHVSDAISRGENISGKKQEPGEAVSGDLVPDGAYPIDVDSDSKMFRVVSAVLICQNGEMNAEITLSGKGYDCLYMGSKEEAAAAADGRIGFTEDKDGRYVYAIPVSMLNVPIPTAAHSVKKDQWYDRNLVFRAETLPEGVLTGTAGKADAVDYRIAKESAEAVIGKADGSCTVKLEGGTGKAYIESPARLFIRDDRVYAELIWSSKNYDYMIVDGEKYEPVRMEPGSVFEIPVSHFGTAIDIIADTTAMSRPHEVSYRLTLTDPVK